MTVMDTGTALAERAAPATIDDEFDLDVRIAVGEGVSLPEAGFTCSWYTCANTCGGSLTSWPGRCC